MTDSECDVCRREEQKVQRRRNYRGILRLFEGSIDIEDE